MPTGNYCSKHVLSVLQHPRVRFETFYIHSSATPTWEALEQSPHRSVTEYNSISTHVDGAFTLNTMYYVNPFGLKTRLKSCKHKLGNGDDGRLGTGHRGGPAGTFGNRWGQQCECALVGGNCTVWRLRIFQNVLLLIGSWGPYCQTSNEQPARFVLSLHQGASQAQLGKGSF